MSLQNTELSRIAPLLTAALAGLMGMGCSDEKEKIVEVPTQPTAQITATTVNKTLTLASFKSLCDSRGGLMQTHASCAGANSCAGVSLHYSSGELTEHTCKGVNGCAGMSCVDLPDDRGLTGAQILEGDPAASMSESQSQCSFCHGDGKTDFQLPIAPGKDPATSIAAFQAKNSDALVNIIAFGLHGINSDGSAFANMPGFYQVYSVAEIKRVVAHLKSLPVEAKEWSVIP